MADEGFVPALSFAPGTILDNRYELLQVLGQGASGVVYKAKIPTLDQLVAVKVLHRDLVHDPKSLERLTREVRVLSQLTDPGVVRINSANLSGEHAYFVMELLAGSSLKDYLTEKGSLSAPQLASIFATVASALAEAHRVLILHRDIKPSNIIVGGTLETGLHSYAKLIDFGLSKSIDCMVQDGKLTATGTIAGTPAYMSPEQCSGQILDERSDIYSFGCVMFEAATGRPPFDGQTPYELMQKQLMEPITFARGDLVADSVKELILRCMEKDPARRPQSMQEIAAFLQGLDTAKLRISISKKPSSIRTYLFVALLFAAAVVCGAVAMPWRGPSRPLTVKEIAGTGANTTTNLTRVTERRRVGLEPFKALLARANTFGDQDNDAAAAAAKKLFEELAKRPDLAEQPTSDRVDFYLSYANFLRGQGLRDKARSFLDQADGALATMSGFPMKRHIYYGVLERWCRDDGRFREAVECSRKNLEFLRAAGRFEMLDSATLDLSDQQLKIDKTGATSFKTIDDAIAASDADSRMRLNAHKAVLSVHCGRDGEFKRALSDVLKSKDCAWSGMELRAIAEALYWKHRYSEGLEMALLGLQRLEPNYWEHRHDYVHTGTLTSMLYRKLEQNEKALAVCDKLKMQLSKLPGIEPSILALVAKERAKIMVAPGNESEFADGQ